LALPSAYLLTTGRQFGYWARGLIAASQLVVDVKQETFFLEINPRFAVWAAARGWMRTVAKMTPEQEASYALSYGPNREDLSPEVQVEYDRLLRMRRAADAKASAATAAGGGDYAERQDVVGMGPARGTLPGAPVQLADQEQVIRKYEAVRARGSSGGTGVLYVTNARVVFYAKAKGRGTQRESHLLQQTRLQDITGITAYTSYRISLGLVLLTIFFALGLIMSLALIPVANTLAVVWVVIYGIATLICALVLADSGSKRGGAGMTINSASTEASPINFGSFAVRQGGFAQSFLGAFSRMFRAYTAFDVAFGMPGMDSTRVIAELGALILDMQQRGELAMEWWTGPDVSQDPPAQIQGVS
jgi:hypothetical protein